jgi:hypothetical protein
MTPPLDTRHRAVDGQVGGLPRWAEHPALVAELTVLSDWSAKLTETDKPPMEWAGWFDYLGRVIARVAALPVAKCSVHGHKTAMTWDVDGFLEARRNGR